MEVRRVRCVINVPNGPSRRVGPNGLLIGRKQDCDLVSDDPSVSRRHALVRLTAEGAELVPLGRGPVELNGKKLDKPAALADGDELGVPGLVLEVHIAAQRPDAKASASWKLERERGGSFGLVHSPFVIGGDDHDDLIIKRWPAHALRCHVAQGELYIEATVAKVTRNGSELEPGAMEQLFVGDQLAFRKETFIVRQAAHDATTAVASINDLPSHVTIEILPRGGRVVLAMADGERAVFLADKRLDLVIALLRPPSGFQPGDFIPDEVVVPIVWPRNPSASRPEINVLIGRCRHDFVEAGLAGARLLQRSPGGGGTRFALAPGAVVVVDS
ncbi:MAG TPA: FHA domain-containing protein [Kofleriaceae bacterium]